MEDQPAQKRPLSHDLFKGPSPEQRELYERIQSAKRSLAALEEEYPLIATALTSWATAATAEHEHDSHLHSLVALKDELSDESEGLESDSPIPAEQRALSKMVNLLIAIEALESTLEGTLSVSGVRQSDLAMAA